MLRYLQIMDWFKNFNISLPFLKKSASAEYFFSLNIGLEKLTAGVWSIEDGKLHLINTSQDKYLSEDQIIPLTDKLLDAALGILQIEPKKILFGVPDSWLLDEQLKEPHLKLLKKLADDLELTPLAYVSTTLALAHFLEQAEGVPATAILVGIGENFLMIAVLRAGRMDGSKVVKKDQDLGKDIEKLLLAFSEIEILPSKMLLFSLTSRNLEEDKSVLVSFPWMERLSFLHFPKIDILEDDIEIKAVSLAGATEFEEGVKYDQKAPAIKISKKSFDNLGFVTGDILAQKEQKPIPEEIIPEEIIRNEIEEKVMRVENKIERIYSHKKWLLIPVAFLSLLIAMYLLLPKANVLIFVEPRVLEKDTQIVADPTVTAVDEKNSKIPGQIVEVVVSGNEKGSASGKKQVGDSARGVIVIRNKTDESFKLSKGVTLTSSNGLKFALEIGVTIASRSAEDGTWSKTNANISAQDIGADGNLPSGTDLTVGGFNTSQLIAKSEGNFSGGTSKEVTVVTDSDQKKLLTTLASNLRKKAQEELQNKLADKKILEEGLQEEITKKSYSKNINDQANEFTLNLSGKYKGTAYSDNDLKMIISKLVTTQVPEGFELNLKDAETSADVSKLEKDGKLIFLARFRARLIPKVDTDKIRSAIRGKTPSDAANTLRKFDNVLGSDIRLLPPIPSPLGRLPVIDGNIKIEVSLK